MMGLLERADASVGHAFARPGDVVLLVGDDGVLDASEYAGLPGGALPDIDVRREVAAIELVLWAAEEGILRSAHDVSGGGLAVALAECAMAGGVGATVQVGAGRRDDEVMFGEGGGRMIVTLAPDEAVVTRFVDKGIEREPVRVTRLGEVGGDAITIRVAENEVSLPVDRARDAYERGLPEALA
jgi:phosphoribosylformylglycinamidine synthase